MFFSLNNSSSISSKTASLDISSNAVGFASLNLISGFFGVPPTPPADTAGV